MRIHILVNIKKKTINPTKTIVKDYLKKYKMSQVGKKQGMCVAHINTMGQHILLTTVTPEIHFQKTRNSLIHPP